MKQGILSPTGRRRRITLAACAELVTGLHRRCFLGRGACGMRSRGSVSGERLLAASTAGIPAHDVRPIVFGSVALFATSVDAALSRYRWRVRFRRLGRARRPIAHGARSFLDATGPHR